MRRSRLWETGRISLQLVIDVFRRNFYEPKFSCPPILGNASSLTEMSVSHEAQ